MALFETLERAKQKLAEAVEGVKGSQLISPALLNSLLDGVSDAEAAQVRNIVLSLPRDGSIDLRPLELLLSEVDNVKGQQDAAATTAKIQSFMAKLFG